MGAVGADIGTRRGHRCGALRAATRQQRSRFFFFLSASLGSIGPAASISISLHLFPSFTRPLVCACPGPASLLRPPEPSSEKSLEVQGIKGGRALWESWLSGRKKGGCGAGAGITTATSV